MNKKLIGPLTWAYAIIIGGALLITPGGIVPIVTKIAGLVGVALGGAAYYFRNEI